MPRKRLTIANLLNQSICRQWSPVNWTNKHSLFLTAPNNATPIIHMTHLTFSPPHHLSLPQTKQTNIWMRTQDLLADNSVHIIVIGLSFHNCNLINHNYPRLWVRLPLLQSDSAWRGEYSNRVLRTAVDHVVASLYEQPTNHCSTAIFFFMDKQAFSII